MAEEEPAMTWCVEKLGTFMTLSGDNKVVSRSSDNGWGVQLASTWLTKDITTVALACEQLEGEAFIGVIGRNFYPSDWDVPLSKTKHAVAIDVNTGRFSHKGANTSFVLRPIQSGARLNMIIDMQVRELTLELIGPDGLTVLSSINIENLPGEVAVAVSFGPGKHSVRLVGTETEKPAMKLLGKLKKDLWDDENVIAPLPLNVKKDNNPNSLKAKAAEIAAAMSLQ